MQTEYKVFLSKKTLPLVRGYLAVKAMCGVFSSNSYEQK